MLKYIILATLTIIGLVVISGCTEKAIQPEAYFEVSPSAKSVPVDVPAKFTITIKAPYSFDPKFEIIPVRAEDAAVLKIDDSQLKQIGHLDINNSISKEISISGKVAYGNYAEYSIKIRLLVDNQTKDEKIINLTVTR